MKTATLAEARAAKKKLSIAMADREGVNGVGIARARAGYEIKLNLAHELAEESLPAEIDGVRVRVEVVGSISKR